MSTNPSKKVEIFKGIYINNQRKKRAGGRIRCPQFKNKIEIYGENTAIHQSEVEWVEVRRYKKEKRNNKVGDKPKDTAKNSEQKNQKGQEKNEKFKQKQVDKKQNTSSEIKEGYKEIKKDKQTKYKLVVDKPEGKQQKKQNYKPKQEKTDVEQEKIQKNQSQKQQIHSQNTKEQHKQPQQSKPTIQQKQSQRQDRQKQSNENGENQRQERKQEDKQEQNQSDSEQEDLQIIVGRIKKQTNIIFKTKPFVGILNFVKRKRPLNLKKGQDLIIDQIIADYRLQLHPIHPRLPIMEVDDIVKENKSILQQYIDKINKFNATVNKKKRINSILDQLENVYILLTFGIWDEDFPLANVHKILGKAMTIDGQCERFLYQHGLNDFHYEQAATVAIPLNPTPLHKPVNKMVFTIDPPTSTDLDDAISIQKIDQKTFLIGIHIADVTSYMHIIDRQDIMRRTTSVYLPYKAYHMLNRNLVKICSLDPNVERLAFTVWVYLDLEGNVIGQSTLEKNIVKSRFKLSYALVQDLISGKLEYEEFNKIYPSSENEYEELLDGLLNLTQLATKHREKRILFDVFENKELEFKQDEERWPIQCYVDQRYTAKKVVEEFMIIGNIESAKHLVKHDPSNSLVIHHPKPTKLSVTMFNQYFKQLEIKFKFDSVKQVQRQLLNIENDDKIDGCIKKIMYFKARRSMEPAIYRLYGDTINENKEKEKEKEKEKNNQSKVQKDRKQPEQQSIQSRATVQPKSEHLPNNQQAPVVHFALGLQFYTHFTSPMRRMADILVHQTLTSILNNQQASKISAETIEKVNNGRKSTKRLKKDLSQVFICLMIYRTKAPLICQGIISSFGMQSVSIYIPMFDMQKQVLWRKQFKVHGIYRRKKDNQLDVKLYHDKVTSKKDIYWVIKRFQKVELTLQCTQRPPLKLVVKMTVQSQKGPYTIEWIGD